MPDNELLSDPLLRDAPVHEGYRVLGGVVLYQKLGQGGMGAVYRGKHLRLDVDVAVKVMDPPAGVRASQAQEFTRRFSREAKVAASIHHTNLIRVYDVNSEGSCHFLVMDFVDGETAGDRLKRKGKLSEQEALQIVLAAAEGLAAAHKKGIIHRDVKPDNIMIAKDGEVRVTDLGLAKAISDNSSDVEVTELTKTQTSMGTPHYMAPEQFASARDVGPRADVWSLGVTLYQLLAGQVPWTDTSVFELAMKVKQEPYPDPKALCSGLASVTCDTIAKALKKNPPERYADCGEMAGALRKSLASLDTGERTLADALAGSTRFALVEVTPPQVNTMTVIGKAVLADAPASSPEPDATDAMPPANPVAAVGLDDVVEKRMDVETRLAGLLRDSPASDPAQVAAIRKELRIAEAVESKDAAAALRRIEKAARALSALAQSGSRAGPEPRPEPQRSEPAPRHAQAQRPERQRTPPPLRTGGPESTNGAQERWRTLIHSMVGGVFVFGAVGMVVGVLLATVFEELGFHAFPSVEDWLVILMLASLAAVMVIPVLASPRGYSIRKAVSLGWRVALMAILTVNFGLALQVTLSAATGNHINGAPMMYLWLAASAAGAVAGMVWLLKKGTFVEYLGRRPPIGALHAGVGALIYFPINWVHQINSDAFIAYYVLIVALAGALGRISRPITGRKRSAATIATVAAIVLLNEIAVGTRLVAPSLLSVAPLVVAAYGLRWRRWLDVTPMVVAVCVRIGTAVLRDMDFHYAWIDAIDIAALFGIAVMKLSIEKHTAGPAKEAP